MMESIQSYDAETAVRQLSVPPDRREELYRAADDLRRACMGDAVHVRGIVEFSNVCANDCAYCGIRRSQPGVERYTLSEEDVMAVARKMEEWQQTTIVLQSGEAPSEERDRAMEALIRRIKHETRLAVTVSAGNRPRDIYARWRDGGMDRYLLRFETSDADLFRRIHPDATLEERMDCLRTLKELGVQAGSGFMIGLPGEDHARLARNILLCRELDLDMIGIGPFIPAPGTPLADARNAWADDPDMLFVALAVLRLFNPDAHIPATTAFDAVFPGRGRNLALQRGANIFMPNSTPGRYRKNYQLYPNKPCIDEDSGDCAHCVVLRLKAIGRPVGTGPGHSIKSRNRAGNREGAVP